MSTFAQKKKKEAPVPKWKIDGKFAFIFNQSSFSKLYMQINSISLRDWGEFQFIEVENARDRSLLEALTAGLLCPLHIGTGVKKI